MEHHDSRSHQFFIQTQPSLQCVHESVGYGTAIRSNIEFVLCLYRHTKTPRPSELICMAAFLHISDNRISGNTQPRNLEET
jgi:hypothetical protein